ncbi:MAG: AraC family transcriptional regulator [Thermoleophilia bacterium]
MDAVAGLLDGPRARGAFLLRTTLDPPWSLRIEDEAPLTLVAVVRGDTWMIPDDAPPTRAGAGDVLVIRGPEPYTMADAPGREPQVFVDPDQRCRTRDGRDLAEEMSQGVRAWGNSPNGASVMLIGTYLLEGEVSGRLLRSLPPLVALRPGDWQSGLVDLLGEEIGRDAPGQEAVLDRLLDLILIAALRAWFARPEAQAPGWYRAHGDPVVGRALRAIHHRPAHPWTLDSLAREAGASRATLSRRFTDLVGEPPMAFLAGWRIALAADLLREPGATIGSVAAQVGYGSPFALSAAFKRVRGVSPRRYLAASAG